jgi:hypothetical protein
MQSVGFLRAHFECEVKMEKFALLLDGFLTLYLSKKFWRMINMERIGARVSRYLDARISRARYSQMIPKHC